jgi:hypothetical protein
MFAWKLPGYIAARHCSPTDVIAAERVAPFGARQLSAEVDATSLVIVIVASSIRVAR